MTQPVGRALAAIIVAAGYCITPSPVVAQGEDGLPAERDLAIMGELLIGSFDNANQAYFDERLKVPDGDRHPHTHLRLKPATPANPNDLSFLATFTHLKSNKKREEIYGFSVDKAAQAVRMTIYDGRNTNPRQGCDLLWRRQAGHFRGTAIKQGCDIEEMQLSEDGFWMSATSLNAPKTSPLQLERTRPFQCYVDVPGVGGGRDVPYKRYKIDDMHDKGAESWITTTEGQEIGIALRNVVWPMNNQENIFTRDSFVIYVSTRIDGEREEKGYSWTSPDAERIGINLKWMLANCYHVSSEAVTPYFGKEPKLAR